MSMNVFELFAKLGLDTSEYDKGLDNAAAEGKSFGSKLTSAFGAAAKGATVAIGAAATAVSALTNAAVSGYAEQEQLVGGIQTLYKNSADTMIKYADNAFKTAGMSANEYMNTAIESSAAMINSLGGDTQKAAEMTNMAIIDMSDNVNKMGTTMEALQSAYRGFSRGNFTMLDNLALGFSGTKEGMQELLDKAKELSGVEYDIGSYADIVQAIHVVQNEMGITGTTAKESADTVTGSFGSIKAAWDNLVVGFADKNADLGKLINDVVGSAEVAFNNMLPVAEQALLGIANFVDNITPIIADKLPGIVDRLLPAVLNAATGLVKALFGALPSLINTIIKQLPGLANAAVEIMNTLMTGITGSLPTLIPALTKAILDIILVLTDPQNVTAFVNAGLELTLGILNGITQAMPQIMAALPVIMQNISDAMIQSAPLIMDAVVQIFNMLIENLPTWLVMITELLPVFMKQFVDALIAEAPILVKGVASMVGILIANLPKILMSLVSAVKNLLLSYLMIGSELSSAFEGDLGSAISKTGESIKAKISGIFNGLLDAVLAPHKAAWEKLTEVVTPVFDKIGSLVSAGINTIKGIIKAAGTLLLIPWQFIWKNFGEDVFGAFAEMGKDIDSALIALAGTIDSALTPKIEAIKSGFVAFCEDTKGAFDLWGQDIDAGLTAFAGKVDEFFTPKIEAMKTAISLLVEDSIGAFALWKEDIDNAFISFAGLVDETFAPAIETIKSVWADMCDSLDNKFTEVAGKLDETWQNIKKAVEDAFAWLEETFVLPHISVEGEWDLKAGKIPEFKVEWFDKAMDNAMVLNGAAIFGASGGRLLGGGESGAEVVSGASTLMSMINQAVSAGSPQQMTVILELDKTQLAKTVYQLNNAETQRVGMRLVNV